MVVLVFFHTSTRHLTRLSKIIAAKLKVDHININAHDFWCYFLCHYAPEISVLTVVVSVLVFFKDESRKFLLTSSDSGDKISNRLKLCREKERA